MRSEENGNRRLAVGDWLATQTTNKITNCRDAHGSSRIIPRGLVRNRFSHPFVVYPCKSGERSSVRSVLIFCFCCCSWPTPIANGLSPPFTQHARPALARSRLRDAQV